MRELGIYAVVSEVSRVQGESLVIITYKKFTTIYRNYSYTLVLSEFATLLNTSEEILRLPGNILSNCKFIKV